MSNLEATAKRLVELAGKAQEPIPDPASYAKQYGQWGEDEAPRKITTRDYFQAACDPTTIRAEAVLEMKEALEACAGGDLASGEGIYKAEIARAVLSKHFPKGSDEKAQ